MSRLQRLEVRVLGAGQVRAEGMLAVVGTLALLCIFLLLLFGVL
jgi:hypothetical protein